MNRRNFFAAITAALSAAVAPRVEGAVAPAAPPVAAGRYQVLDVTFDEDGFIDIVMRFDPSIPRFLRGDKLLPFSIRRHDGTQTNWLVRVHRVELAFPLDEEVRILIHGWPWQTH